MSDQLGRILAEVDDVDLLAAELAHDLADALPHGSDARALRIDPGDRGSHGDLRAMPRFASESGDLDTPIGDLGNLQREESTHEGGMGSGHGHLRPTRSLAHARDHAFDAGAVGV